MTTSLNVANSVYLGTLMTFARSSSPNLSEVFLSLNFEKLLSAPMSWGYISSNFSSLRSGRSSRIAAAFWKNVNPILFHSGRRESLRFRTLFFKSGFGKLGEIGEHAKTVLTLTSDFKNACAVTQRKCQPLYERNFHLLYAITEGFITASSFFRFFSV